MNKLIALCFTLCLSLSAFAQSDGQALPKGEGEELIVVDADDLEQSLKRLAQALRTEQRTANIKASKSQSNTLRLQLLLHLLQQSKQTPVISLNQQGQPIVLPQLPSSPHKQQRVEDYSDRLERIETMLLILLNKQGTTATTTQPIINKRTKQGNQQQRIAELEAQLATLLARKPQSDTVTLVDTVRVVETITNNLQSPQVIVQRDTLYKEVNKVEAVDFKRSIYFALGKSTLDARSQKTMQEVRNFLKKFPEAKVAILGFASPDGNAERNRQLAERRMESAVQYLVRSGIQSQIETYVGGVDEKAPNHQLARRVDIILVK